MVVSDLRGDLLEDLMKTAESRGDVWWWKPWTKSHEEAEVREKEKKDERK